MTKRKGLFDVKVDVRSLLEDLPVSTSIDSISKPTVEYPGHYDDTILISQALDVITRQMKVSGNRSRTISDYVLHVEHFQSVTNVQYVEILHLTIFTNCWII